MSNEKKFEALNLDECAYNWPSSSIFIKKRNLISIAGIVFGVFGGLKFAGGMACTVTLPGIGLFIG